MIRLYRRTIGADELPRIHPTAQVDPKATLADDVEIGPGAVVVGAVEIGAGTRLMGPCYLHGPMKIGRRNVIYPFAVLGMEPQDRKFDPVKPTGGVVIGDDNIIREGVTIHRATGAHPTTLGSNNFLMCNSHVAHDCRIADHVTLVNGSLLGGHVEVQDRAIVSGNAVVQQFCRVGRLAMVSGAQGAIKDVPPFCILHITRVVGMLNLVGLRRAGYRESIRPLQRAFELLYMHGLSNENAAQYIERELGADPLCMELAAFVKTAKRGITPYRARLTIEREDPDA